jgi:protein tyrosine phosphatase (PTP) superfamily phosphohydrolase (DUF442 family)
MAFEDILNHIKISELISTSGQPSPNQFQEIADAGFTTVINLAMPDSTNALPDEGGFVTEAGMNYFHIPVPFEAPTRKHLSLFLKLMKSTDGQKVWVHCALNMRVSAFMQHYQRTVLKRAEPELIPLLKNWEPEDVWQSFLKLYRK